MMQRRYVRFFLYTLQPVLVWSFIRNANHDFAAAGIQAKFFRGENLLSIRRNKSYTISFMRTTEEESSSKEDCNRQCESKNIVSRRSLLFSYCAAFTAAAAEKILSESPAFAAETDDATAAATTTAATAPIGSIIKLLSGVQYSDQRVGQGPAIKKEDTVLLHLRALRYDGKVLLDTKEDGDGRPLLHKLGSAENDYGTLFFSGKSSSTSNNPFLPPIQTIRSKVTPGVEDAILSLGQGMWEGGFGKVEPMNQGGIRKVVVPGPLAYGNAGVSRYDAMRMGLREPVPRDELLRYEVEILRCLDVELPSQADAISLDGEDGKPPTKRSAQACCTEDTFPCPVSTEPGQNIQYRTGI